MIAPVFYNQSWKELSKIKQEVPTHPLSPEDEQLLQTVAAEELAYENSDQGVWKTYSRWFASYDIYDGNVTQQEADKFRARNTARVNGMYKDLLVELSYINAADFQPGDFEPRGILPEQATPESVLEPRPFLYPKDDYRIFEKVGELNELEKRVCLAGFNHFYGMKKEMARPEHTSVDYPYVVHILERLIKKRISGLEECPEITISKFFQIVKVTFT